MSDAKEFYQIFKMDKSRRRWRLLSIIVIIILFVTLSPQKSVVRGNYIAKLNIEGFIGEDDEQISVLDKISSDKKIKALILHINSGGGTMVGGVNIYQAVRRISAQKPVVVTMGTMAASAGYMIALAGDYVIANQATLTGSIGVFMPLVDATELTNKIGIKSAAIASGNMKMATLPIEKRSPEATRYLQNMVNDLQKIFIGYVSERRNISQQNLKLVSDGRAVTGRQALSLGLVDNLGGELEAKQWLIKQHNINNDIPIIKIEQNSKSSLLEKLLVNSTLFTNIQNILIKQPIMSRIY